jgi:hypothetical protein
MNLLESLWSFGAFTNAQFAQLSNQIAALDGKVDTLMAAVQVDQDELDALAASLQTIATNLADEITALQQQLATAGTPLPAGSLDGVNAQVAALQALEPPAPTPA